MGWRLRLSDKTVRKFAQLPIYCQRQKCSPGNVVSGSLWDIREGSLERGVKWEWGRWKWRFSLHSFTVFRTFYIHGHTTAFTWCDCWWPWWYFKVIKVFHLKFLKNGAWYGKYYYRSLIGNHTLAFDWCNFWWPWSTFEGYFSLGCHFHVHFSNPWHAFTSHGLPAIAEVLVKPLPLQTRHRRLYVFHASVRLSVHPRLVCVSMTTPVFMDGFLSHLSLVHLGTKMNWLGFGLISLKRSVSHLRGGAEVYTVQHSALDPAIEFIFLVLFA